jgi:RNA polymerase sigma-70 factor (ECF subfamily)
MRFMRRTDEAEDAVQDAFLAYYTAGSKTPENEVGPWLHRVLVNGCIDRLRRRDRWKAAELDDDTVMQSPGSPVLGLDLAHAVARLPEKARVIFLLHDVEGFKHRELGEMLQVSVGTTKSQLFRARRMLRDFMQRGSS